MHGSNRLGGNSLSDLLVFGRRAGHNAAYAAHRLRDARPQVRRRRRARRGGRGPRAVRDRDGGENPYTIQKDLQDVMQRLVGIIRKADELRESLEGDRQAQGARQAALGRGAPAVQPRLAPRDRPDQHAGGLRVHREGRARARGVPRRAHPRRLPRPDDAWGTGQPGAHPGRWRLRLPVHLKHQPLPVMPDELQSCSTHTPTAGRPVETSGRTSTDGIRPEAARLAGRQERRRPRRLHRRGRGGRGRARRDPPAAGHPGRRPRGAVELQGRQVRVVQRRGQRPAAADVHDPALGLRGDRDDHRHPAARLPGDPRPGHRRLVQLREGQAGAGRAAHRRATPTASAG